MSVVAMWAVFTGVLIGLLAFLMRATRDLWETRATTRESVHFLLFVAAIISVIFWAGVTLAYLGSTA